jgi:hypothetical protein
MTVKIDGPKAIQLLRDVVRGREDHIDENSRTGSCAYGSMGDDSNPIPGCIVGHAVHAAGLPMRVLDLMDSLGSVTSVYDALEEFKSGAVEDPEIVNEATELGAELELTTTAAGIFRSAQDVQDHVGTWGEALAAAEKRFDRIYNTEE